ncbi:PorT family protein [Flavobacteriales bacterium]|nr:PorT family protein [Flavobacteriales bacterium]
MKDKDLKDISNQEQFNYELKPEYLDDLTNKLNDQRPAKKRGYFGYLAVLLLLLIGGSYFLYPKGELNELAIIEGNKEIVNTQLKSESEVVKAIDLPEKESINSNLLQESVTVSSEVPTKNKVEIKTEGVQKISVESIKKEVFNSENTQGTINTNQLKNRSSQKNTTETKVTDIDKVNLSTESDSKKGDLALKSPNNKVKNQDEDKNNAALSTIKKSDKTLLKTEIVDPVSKVASENKFELVGGEQNEVPLINKANETKNQENTPIKTADNKALVDSVEPQKSINKEDIIPITDSIITSDTLDLVTQADSVSIKLEEARTRDKWQVSALSGVNFSISRLGNSTNQEYLTKRTEEENYLTNYTGGIMLERFITDKIKLGTGLTYISYGSNNSYSSSTVYDDFQQFKGLDSVYNPTIDSIFYQPSGTWLPYLIRMDTTLDSAFVAQQKAREDSAALNSSGKVSFSYVELPLLIGYYKTINKWSFGLNTGVSVGLLTQSSGSFIDENLVSMQVAQSQQLVWNYLLSPEFNYQFNEKLYLGFQPFFRMGLNNLSLSEPIDRSYYSIQFNAKIGVRF